MGKVKNHNSKTVNKRLVSKELKGLFKMKMLLLIVLLVILTIGTTIAQNGNLTVNVTNFKNTKGACRYWLYNSADGYPTDEKKALKIVEAPIINLSSSYTFENLPDGIYAVAVLHDENGNHKFDTNFLGIPKEHYGNSNGARGSISGPPKFKNASFVHTKTGTVITIKVE